MNFWLILFSWMFISSGTTIYFFEKKFIFSNVYVLVNTIFECLHMFFGWEMVYQLSTYAIGGGWEVIQNACSCVQGRDVTPHVYVCTYTISCFHVFSSFFCLIVSCFVCRNLTLIWSIILTRKNDISFKPNYIQALKWRKNTWNSYCEKCKH